MKNILKILIESGKIGTTTLAGSPMIEKGGNVKPNVKKSIQLPAYSGNEFQ